MYEYDYMMSAYEFVVCDLYMCSACMFVCVCGGVCLYVGEGIRKEKCKNVQS